MLVVGVSLREALDESVREAAPVAETALRERLPLTECDRSREGLSLASPLVDVDRDGLAVRVADKDALPETEEPMDGVLLTASVCDREGCGGEPLSVIEKV